MPLAACACHVFAFEGRGGFPGWAVPGGDAAPRKLRDQQGNVLLERGLLSLSQVLNYWHDAVRAAGDACRWRYYAQDQWRRAVADALQLAAAPTGNGDGHGAIALLGFSNGGDAAYQTALALDRRGVPIDLVVTADPVRKPLRGLGLLGFQKPPNVARWHNFFQRCDRRTLAGLLPVVGRAVEGADSNRQLMREDFLDPAQPDKAHLWLPALEIVRAKITEELAALA